MIAIITNRKTTEKHATKIKKMILVCDRKKGKSMSVWKGGLP